jgi:hypothetical protein
LNSGDQQRLERILSLVAFRCSPAALGVTYEDFAPVEFEYTDEGIRLGMAIRSQSTTTRVMYIPSTPFEYGNFDALLPKKCSYVLPTPSEDRLLFLQEMTRAEFLIFRSLHDGSTHLTFAKPVGGSVKAAAAWMQKNALLEYPISPTDTVVGHVRDAHTRWTPYDWRGDKKTGRCSVVGHWSAKAKTWSLYAQILDMGKLDSGDKGYRIKDMKLIWFSRFTK